MSKEQQFERMTEQLEHYQWWLVEQAEKASEELLEKDVHLSAPNADQLYVLARACAKSKKTRETFAELVRFSVRYERTFSQLEKERNNDAV